jgi:hypothetical protein
MTYSQHNGTEYGDGVWDPVPGEPPMSPMPDYELGIPASYFEYEIDNKMHFLMCFDQQYIPESERPCPVEKNPNCSAEYWKPQVDLEEVHKMEDPKWVPNNNQVNVYNKKSFTPLEKYNTDESSRI